MGIISLSFKQKLCWLVATLLTISFVSPVVHAGSYDVNAKINFKAPTSAAVIDSELDGTTVTNSYFNVSGTCEVASPNHLISIVNNGVTVGSTSCTNSGIFSINISLVLGLNTLIAKSASVSELYGPDSDPISVTLLPPTPSPTTPPQPSLPTEQQPSSSKPIQTQVNNITADKNNAINKGAASGLKISIDKDFAILNKNNDASIIVVINGGEMPYALTINWGDGSTDSKSVAEPGSHQLSHHYEKSGSYNIRGEVVDSNGATTYFEYIVATEKYTPKPIVTPATEFTPKESANYFGVMMLGAFLIVALMSYYLGRSIEHHHPVKHKKRAGRT